MSRHVLDCCTLLNLFSGWGGVKELHDFGEEWSIGERALAETGYVQEYGPDGQLERIDLDRTTIFAQYPLTILTLEHAEQLLLLQLAERLDDGEAEGLAMAIARKKVFVSDDRLVRVVARDLGLSVEIAGTPQLLLAWAGTDTARTGRLPRILRRIEDLARFRPHKSDSHYEWWLETLSSTK